ncbi:MAG: replicative DNA helicase [Desulfovibrionaceae bacterium]|nr:replicative DNA helicase [Desulfovibrionaceae bacterium]
MSQFRPQSSSGHGPRGASVPERRTAESARIPPHNTDAEAAVLSAILTSSESASSVIDIIRTPEDFYDPRHAAIYQAFLAIYEKDQPCNIVSCAEQLKALNLYEKSGGAGYLSELAMSIVSAVHVEFYATVVRNKAIQRAMIATCSTIIGSCYETHDDITSLLDESEQSIFLLAERADQRNIESTPQIISNLFDHLAQASDKHNELTGVTTGFTALDRLTAGLQASDLIIVAARPSMGKTAFALSLAVNAALSADETPVAIFSLEMSREQLVQRMLSLKAHVDMSKLRQAYRLTEEDWNALYTAAEDLNRAKIYIDDTATLSTMDLRARVRRLKARHDIGLVLVDYLQLMRSPRAKESRELEISDISRTLKAIAKDLNIPVVALSQLNRKVEERSRDDKRPQLSDLRESGAIEQDADIIMFIYRDDVYKIKDPSERPPNQKAEIIIGKQRNGPTGVAELLFRSQYTSFENMTNDWAVAQSEG